MIQSEKGKTIFTFVRKPGIFKIEFRLINVTRSLYVARMSENQDSKYIETFVIINLQARTGLKIKRYSGKQG